MGFQRVIKGGAVAPMPSDSAYMDPRGQLFFHPSILAAVRITDRVTLLVDSGTWRIGFRPPRDGDPVWRILRQPKRGRRVGISVRSALSALGICGQDRRRALKGRYQVSVNGDLAYITLPEAARAWRSQNRHDTRPDRGGE